MTAPVSFWFRRPLTPEEADRQLDAIYQRRHATHDRPAPFCPLCPPRTSRHAECQR